MTIPLGHINCYIKVLYFFIYLILFIKY